MKTKDLKLTIEGPLWSIHEVAIENISLIGKWDQEADKGWVSVKNFDISDDRVLDFYVKLAAPNGTEYKIGLEGKLDENTSISFSKKYTVKNGLLRVQESLNL